MTLRDVHAEIAEHCGEIAKLFKPGAKVTVIVRNPGEGVGHSAAMAVGDDDLAQVISAIEYLRTREELAL